MRTYRNEKHGFEFEVPDEWSLPKGDARQLPSGEAITFGCNYDESFYLLIAPLRSTYFPGLAEFELRQFAIHKGCSNLELGRINIENEEHVWARYYMGYGRWGKKYKLVLFDTEYTITASYIDNSSDHQMFLQRQQVWDAILTSFRLVERHKEDKCKPEMAKEAIEQKMKEIIIYV